MPASLFKMKSGGSSAVLPPLTGCEPREGLRRPVIALGHSELAVQATRPRLSCEAVVKGRSGTATAQPASIAAAVAAANFKVFQFADASCRDCSMSSPHPLPGFALPCGCDGLIGSYWQEERRINFNGALLHVARLNCSSIVLAGGLKLEMEVAC
jgi:hypothetical protein